jgi:hypothetical protein
MNVVVFALARCRDSRYESESAAARPLLISLFRLFDASAGDPRRDPMAGNLAAGGMRSCCTVSVGKGLD